MAAISKRAFPQLTFLNIADNDLGTAITVELMNCLRAGVCPLQTLILHDNRIGSTVGALLGEVLLSCSRLEVVDIKQNRLKSEGLDALFATLDHHTLPSLKSFAFSDNEESQDVVSRFCSLIAGGCFPALEYTEWTSALSSSLPLSCDLLVAIHRAAPRLTLPLTSLSCRHSTSH